MPSLRVKFRKNDDFPDIATLPYPDGDQSPSSQSSSSFESAERELRDAEQRVAMTRFMIDSSQANARDQEAAHRRLDAFLQRRGADQQQQHTF
jgi:hypothetical protein